MEQIEREGGRAGGINMERNEKWERKQSGGGERISTK